MTYFGKKRKKKLCGPVLALIFTMMIFSSTSRAGVLILPQLKGGRNCGSHIKLETKLNGNPGIAVTRLVETSDANGNMVLIPKERLDFYTIGTYKNEVQDEVLISVFSQNGFNKVFKRDGYTAARDPSDYGFSLTSLLEINQAEDAVGVLWNWYSEVGILPPAQIKCFYKSL